MIRITTLLWIALLVVAGGTVMHVSYQVRHVEKHISDLARDTRQEQEAIRILTAEWDTLNDPQRIDGLAKRYLALESTPIARVVTLEEIPLRPSEEQLANLSAAASAKVGKGPRGNSRPALNRPEEAAKGPPAVALLTTTTINTHSEHVTQAGNTAGEARLVLARVERR
jgi:cell division protein FtsL